jgi:hypothetical protein
MPITPGMDLHDQLSEHLGLDSALTPEQAAQILVGAAGYARDALQALEQCTDPALDQMALRDLTRRATVIESHLRALHQLTRGSVATTPRCATSRSPWARTSSSPRSAGPSSASAAWRWTRRS